MICSLCAGAHLPADCALGRAIIATEHVGYSSLPTRPPGESGTPMFLIGDRWCAVRPDHDYRPRPTIVPTPTVHPSGRRAVPRARLTVVGF